MAQSGPVLGNRPTSAFHAEQTWVSHELVDRSGFAWRVTVVTSAPAVRQSLMRRS